MKGGGVSGLEPDAKEAPPPLARPPSRRGHNKKEMMVRAAPLGRRDAGHGGMKGAHGLTGRDPSERGVLWSIGCRPPPPVRTI